MRFDALPACAVPSSTNPETAVCTLWTVMRNRRASSLNEIPGVPRMWPRSPYFRVLSPSGLSAAASSDSQTRLSVSSMIVGLKGGGSGMGAG